MDEYDPLCKSVQMLSSLPPDNLHILVVHFLFTFMVQSLFNDLKLNYKCEIILPNNGDPFQSM